ncbi:hypothetical protein ACFWBS_51060 [Streptomyces mirabilis]|uniref:hypothetical protein n=1 Tax=Streptomyces mirabilis TaxID=68239 RepID=UPI0033DF3817
MHRARIAGSEQVVEAGQIGPPQEFNGELICWKCPVPVTAVGSHMRAGVLQPALFRLAARHTHEDPPNPVSVTYRIARGACGLADVAAEGVLRLNLPADFAHVPPVPPSGGPLSGPGGPGPGSHGPAAAACGCGRRTTGSTPTGPPTTTAPARSPQ